MCIKKALWLLPLLFATACASHTGKYSSATAADSAGTEKMATASPSPGKLQDHKFIDTAVLQCKVQDVFKSTTRLEQLVTSLGGIVQESHMSNNAIEIKTTDYKEDSLRQVQTYTTSAVITVRVPTRYLDSVVNAIPAMSTFIDSRSLTQSDATYNYLENELKNHQADDKQAITQAHALAKKTDDAITTQQYENETANERIVQKINNMQIQDNVDYATINVTFSQPERVYVQAIVNAPFFYKVPFATRCKTALYNGYDLLSALAIGFINIWPLLLIAAGIWLVYRRVKQKKLQVAEK